MPRRTTEPLTEREAQIMDAIWRLGEATADQVRAEVPGSPHDSTVRTLLRVLESKGFVAHEARGKAYVYRATIARRKAQGQAVRSVLARFFGGSAEDLVLRLIEDEQLSPERLEELRRSAAAASSRGKRKKGGA